MSRRKSNMLRRSRCAEVQSVVRVQEAAFLSSKQILNLKVLLRSGPLREAKSDLCRLERKSKIRNLTRILNSTETLHSRKIQDSNTLM